MAFDAVSFVMGRNSAPKSEPVLENLSVTRNGTYTPEEGVDGFSRVAVNVSAGENSGGLRMAKGRFDATSAIQTVTHDIGEVPDIIIVTRTSLPGVQEGFMWVGYSQAMVDTLGGEWINSVRFILSSAGGLVEFLSEEGIDGENASRAEYGVIRNFTDTEFTIGGSTVGLKVGESYSYQAICGIL